MRRIFILTLFTALVLTMVAGTNRLGKVTGLAQQALMEQRGRQVAASRGTAVADNRRLTAFVRVARHEADEVLRRHHCRILAKTGDISIVSIPLNALEALAQEPAVGRIEAGGRAQTMLDTTLTIVNARPVYEATDRHQAFTGEGVVVGLMDVGFDLSHPTFRDASGSHFRVGAFWDQLSTDTIGSTFPVGRDFVGYDAVSSYGHSVDAPTQYHGNHTAGIAAGSGYTMPYQGLAYESDICLVSNAISADTAYIDAADYYKYTTAVDALGFKYIYDYADRQGKPCVVSFSEGYLPYIDEEDSLYAVFMDSLTSIPGHIFVASAGNEGLLRTYFEKPAGMAVAGSFLNSGNKEAMYKLKADGPMSFRLHAFDTSTREELCEPLTIMSADGRLDSLSTDTLLIGADTCVVMACRYPMAVAASQDTCYVVMLKAGRKLNFCKLAMVVEGVDTRVEAYGSVSHSFTSWNGRPEWDAAVYGHNIMAPGCFPSTICVGATSHREHVVNYKGVVRKMGTPESGGRRAGYSSTGPALNGVMKPDVVAPGSIIVSSYSRFFLDANPDKDTDIIGFSEFLGRDYPWLQATGTSMSAPVVAGAIALWLQANPQLTQQAVKDVLSRTCRHPETELDYPNNEYGYGEIDVYRGLLDVLGLDGIEGLTQQGERLRIVPRDGGILLMFDEMPLPQTFIIKVFGLGGTEVCRMTQTVTSQNTPVALPVSSGNVYAIQVCAGGRVLGAQLLRF